MSATLYLDANATTAVLPQALEAAVQAMVECFGNPSSSHSHGLVAKALLEQVHRDAVRVLGAGSGRVIFNSGATEGLQTAVLSALCEVARCRRAGEAAGSLLVYGATEHTAVPAALAHWNRVLNLGLQLQALPVDVHGQHDLQALRRFLPEAALVCTMAANNETGAITDLGAIDNLLGVAPVRPLWLVDGVQALGKLPLQLAHSGIDYAVFSGHKLHAPKGVGLLYVRDQAPFTPLVVGGGQQDEQRSGTENLPGIAAFGAVLQRVLAGDTFLQDATLSRMRAQLVYSLEQAFPGIVFNSPPTRCLPGTLNFSVPGLPSKTLLDVFDAAGVRVSAGSACSAAKAQPSHVLQAMGLPAWRTESAVRLSIGVLASPDLIDHACVAIARCGQALRHRPSPVAPVAPLPPGSAPVTPETFTLDWQELDAFFRAHPQARLVDLREAAELGAGEPLHHGGRSALSLPASTLSPQCLLTEAAAGPWVLFCRSGNRSAQAAHWLHSHGQTQVRHVRGGLALRPVGPA